MNTAMILALTVGVTWTIAPILGRLSGLNGSMMFTLIATGSFITMLPMAFSQNYGAASVTAVSLGLAAGILNGIGLKAFYQIIDGGSNGLWDMAQVSGVAYVLVPVGITIGMKAVFGDAITTDKVIGIALACGAIWFLK